jgi:hypothetical protein
MGCCGIVNGFCKWFEDFFCAKTTFVSVYGERKVVEQRLIDTLKESNFCAVCQDVFSRQRDNIYATPCFHLFHENCIQPWMDGGARTCPTCRAEIDFEKTKWVWRQFYGRVQGLLELPEGEQEEGEQEEGQNIENDGQVAGAVFRQELSTVDQLTQDYLLAIELQARERDV